MISIIIPTLNEEKNLELCFKSLFNQTYRDFEVFVVDGGSKDTTLDIAKNNGIKVVEVSKRRPHDVSFARNEGMKAANGDALIFLDADILLSKNCLEVVNRFFKDPEVVGVSCRTLPFNGNTLEYLMYDCNNLLARISNRLDRYEMSYFSCLGYRKDSFLKVGGFREDLHACEDLDLTRRLRGLGKFIFTDETFCFASPRRLRRWSYSGYILKYIKYLSQYYFFNKIFDYYDDLD